MSWCMNWIYEWMVISNVDENETLLFQMEKKFLNHKNKTKQSKN